MNLYGLIGYPLSHSFSKKYFSEKFRNEGIRDCAYELFPLPHIAHLPDLLKEKAGKLQGLNVTIPYKQEVIPFLDELDPVTAGRIGAVNTIRIFPDGSTKGYNTDYFGFKTSLEEWIDHHGENCSELKALVLGSGGASKAVVAALDDLQTPYLLVSRSAGGNTISYADLSKPVLEEYRLIVNTTPLGMTPQTETAPPLPYELLHRGHYLYDLVYNPEQTLFMKKGKEKGAATLNGLKMLYLQAEKAWSIWRSEE